LCGLRKFSAFDCPAIFSKTPRHFLHVTNQPWQITFTALVRTAPVFRINETVGASRRQSAYKSGAVFISDSAPAFDEFLIRSEHRIARGAPINSRTIRPLRETRSGGSAEKNKHRLNTQRERNIRMSTQPASATPALQFPRTPDRLLNSREVAAWLGVSLDWVQAHATRRNPRIPAVLLGAGRHGRQMLRFRREDLEKFILDHMGEPSSLRRRA